jgi:hypothetical protein
LSGERALLRLALLVLALTAQSGWCDEDRSLTFHDGQALRFRIVTEPANSALPAALALLRDLANGDLEAAAARSNEPARRLKVLRDYQAGVGAEEFKRVYRRYFAPGNRPYLEVAIGRRHLLIWDLGEAGNRLAGQFFLEQDGLFLLDDVPSPERAELRRVLEAYREKTGSP